MSPHSRRMAVGLATATTGFALCAWAWQLLSPVESDITRGFGVDGVALVLLAAASVAVGSLGRVPVGWLADRYGAHLVLAVICLAASVPLLALRWVDSAPALLVVACALGIAGTAFPAGAALVARTSPPGRRGIALSGYGAGLGGASVAALLSERFPAMDGRAVLVPLALALAAFAAVAATVPRTGPAPARDPGPPLRVAAAMWRLPATRHLAIWYAASFGGLVSGALFLPVFLSGVYALDDRTATLATAGALGVAAVARPVGGWLSEHRDPAAIFARCALAVAGFGLLLAFHPSVDLALTAVVGTAAGMGTASGVVLALIGRTAPVGRVGLIAGTVGAAGGLAGLIPPALLTAVYLPTGSYAIGFTLLASLGLAGAAYLRVRRGWIGAALAFPATGVPDRTALTVVTLEATEAARNAQGILGAIAALAAVQETVIVYGQPAGRTGLSPQALIAGLRVHLPRHTCVAVCVADPPARREEDLLAELVEDGAIAVAVTPAADLNPVTARLAERLGVDQMLRLRHDHVDGVRLNLSGAGTPEVGAGGDRGLR